MITAGVDLSADPKKTASCLIDWASKTVRLRHSGVTDADVVELARRSDLVGLDVPLGWPMRFVAAVSGHELGRDWPEFPSPLMRYRVTDLLLQSSGHRPLSVSSDLIGVVAFRGARIQTLLRTEGLMIDRSGMTGRVVEVYPAAALKLWGLAATGYKGTAGAERRADLVVQLERASGCLAPSLQGQLLGAADHALDAFVCAVLAGAARAGVTSTPTADQVEAARVEGWIHVPTQSLAETIEAVARQEERV